ncbi:hypothetical protein ACF0H5_017275 [Mactra antiquata]
MGTTWCLWCVHASLLLCILNSVDGQAIDGCPMYGCRPSGSFSYAFDAPRYNATIGWSVENFVGPIPEAMGCVGNSVALVCQSNGPGPADTGLMSLDLSDGKVRWRDPILRFPVLPVMDVDGNIWASDGFNLMHYDTNGKPISDQIRLDPDMRPLLGINYIPDNDFILLVSGNGQITTKTSDGTPMAELVLKGSVERANGTFLPVAPAVVNGNRFYVLTEFAPDNGAEVGNLGLQRLYAIDTFSRMTGRIEIAWYANFERESRQKNSKTGPLRYRPKSWRRKLRRTLKNEALPKPSILYDKFLNTIYISLPPPMLRNGRDTPNAMEYLIGVKDLNNDSALVFRAPRSGINLVAYEMNTQEPQPNAGDQLWVSVTDGNLLAIGRDGNISKAIKLEDVLKTKFKITSKLTVMRAREADEDFLVFGIEVEETPEEFLNVLEHFNIKTSEPTPTKFVLGVDTPENDKASSRPFFPLAWMVATPDDSVVNGQIIGIQSTDASTKDMLVVFSQVEGKFGKYFTIV